MNVISTLPMNSEVITSPQRGYEIYVNRQSRAKNSPPMGTIAIIVGYKDGDWGRVYYVKDKHGNFYRCPPTAFTITNTQPDWSPPEDTIPVVVIPRQPTAWVVFNILGPRGEERIWLNTLYLNGRKCQEWDKYRNVIVFEGADPEDPGYKITVDQAFQADMSQYHYEKWVRQK